MNKTLTYWRSTHAENLSNKGQPVTTVEKMIEPIIHISMKRVSDLAMIAAKAVAATFLSLHLLQGCGGGCLKTNNVRTMLNSSLKIGDTQLEIETVLSNKYFK